MTTAEVLRRAAEAYRNGDIPWGREWFIKSDRCRCALGGITWAADPADEDGNPMYAGPAAADAAMTLARYLVDELGASAAVELDSYGNRMLDPVETVGGWNDEPDRTLDEVIAALEAASERAA